MRAKKIYILVFLVLCFSIVAQEHPSLVLTKKGVQEIRSQLGKVPLFDASLAEVKAEVDAVIAKPISVPTPKDMAGGFTHEQHKKNYLLPYTIHDFSLLLKSGSNPADINRFSSHA